MKAKIYKIVSSGFFTALAGALWLPFSALAQSTTTVTTQDPITRCHNFKAQFMGVFDWVPDSYCTASGIAVYAINTLLAFAGTAAIIFLIVGGFWYLGSAGNEETSEKGKKTITNAVIGLVVVILAAAIVRIIGSLVTAGK
jgi:hypothetical protein